MRDRISVVICAYTEKRWDDLKAALESIKHQTLPAHEVVVVIDHNPALFDRTREAYPDLIVINNSNERGLSGARNSGVSVATGEIIAFMDEDAVADNDWLECLQTGYSDATVMGVGGAILPLWEDSRPDWFPTEFDWVVGCTYRGMPEKTARVRNLIGCNMSFRREVFNRVGGFRQGMGRLGVIPLGCEETELCIRVNQSYQQDVLLFDPRARVYHRVPRRRESYEYFISRCYSEGISKALVAHWVGTSSGLSNERAYTYHTLPAAVRQGIKDFFTKFSFSGLARAFTVIFGLFITTFGYVYGQLKSALQTLGNPTPQPGVTKIEAGSARDRS